MTTVNSMVPMSPAEQAKANEAARKNARKVGDGSDLAANKDMFLQLLVAQLKNQDPSSPMDQKDMMAQMAQFTQVEQSANMVKAMETMAFNNSVSQAVSLIGHEVNYTHTDAVTGSQSIKTAKVESITNSNGVLQLRMDDGAAIDPSLVTRVF